LRADIALALINDQISLEVAKAIYPLINDEPSAVRTILLALKVQVSDPYHVWHPNNPFG